MKFYCVTRYRFTEKTFCGSWTYVNLFSFYFFSFSDCSFTCSCRKFLEIFSSLGSPKCFFFFESLRQVSFACGPACGGPAARQLTFSNSELAGFSSERSRQRVGEEDCSRPYSRDRRWLPPTFAPHFDDYPWTHHPIRDYQPFSPRRRATTLSTSDVAVNSSAKFSPSYSFIHSFYFFFVKEFFKIFSVSCRNCERI